MIISATPLFDNCHRALAWVIVGCSLGGPLLAALMLWWSAGQLRRTRQARRRRARRVELAILLLLGIALVPWACWQVASEPVLVSGHLNPLAGMLAFFSLWLAVLAARARQTDHPMLSAAFFCYGAAILLGTTAGWTWRALQPCKHHHVSSLTLAQTTGFECTFPTSETTSSS